jgi:hypothetical protein
MTGDSHTATLMWINDYRGRRVVVTQADPVIWIADELMQQATTPGRDRFSGDLTVDGDHIAFGTPGEGLGRLTYRITGVDPVHHWHIATRMRDEAAG